MKISPTIHHFWTIANMGGLFFTAAVYVGLLLYQSTYTPAPCDSFIDALAGDSAAASDILMSKWFRIWELVFVLFQVGLLLGYFTLHGVMTFYENPEEAHKFLVLSAEIFFGWLVFGFRVFGLHSTDVESSCTEVDVSPQAYWVVRASSMLFSPLIGVVAIQVASHVAIYVMEHYKKGNAKVFNGLNLAIKVFEIILGAFGMAMGICYGIWSHNPWVRAAMWVALSTCLINVWVKYQWIARWTVEAAEEQRQLELEHQQLHEDPEFAPEAHRFHDPNLASNGTSHHVEMTNYAKDAKYDGDVSPISPNTNAYSQPPSAQLRAY